MRHKKRGKAAKKARAAMLSSAQEEGFAKAPHSFVYHKGQVGKSMRQLVMDCRKIFEPFTAAKLKVRKNNSLRDLVEVASVLHVTHFVCFTKTDVAPYVRFMCTPRGPTLTFKIQEYCLSRDVVSTLRHPNIEQSVYQNPPLLVMKNLNGNANHIKLMATVFHNMLPQIDVTGKLTNVRRVLLLNYEEESKTLELRHYLIRIVPTGISKATKKLLRPKLPDLGKFTRMDEFVEKGGNMSESEGEMDGPHNEVVLPQDVRGRGNVKATQSAIRLKETGPRLTLQLVKIEEGLGDGAVLFHEFVSKTPEEVQSLKAMVEKKRQLRERRKREQLENIRKKAEKKEKNKQKSLAGMKKKTAQAADGADESSSDDDAAYFKEEVGKAPDKDMFPRKRKHPVSKKKMEGPATKRRKPELTANKKRKSGQPANKRRKPELTANKKRKSEPTTNKKRKPEGSAMKKKRPRKFQAGD
ncbi:suppressor of SWI4 1 homolog isoform X2 [Babylonia areolata]|uniref:suppressor of SWI4 1 homolog isoform X2 n=1 Tax=Babylonia areolata TaxID=304850 RepID=UPI003FD5233B